MGIPGKQSKRGEGEKESDGSPRDSLLRVKLPSWKINKLKEIAKNKRLSLTDLISLIVDYFLGNLADAPTQKKDSTDEG